MIVENSKWNRLFGVWFQGLIEDNFCHSQFFSMITTINQQNYIVDGSPSYITINLFVASDFIHIRAILPVLWSERSPHVFYSLIYWVTNKLPSLFYWCLLWRCKPLVWCHHNIQEISGPAGSSEHTLWIKRLNIRILLTIMFSWFDHVRFIIHVQEEF